MADISYPIRLICAHGTASEWIESDPVLKLGEISYASDENRFKVGDGVKRWSELGYVVGETNPTISLDDSFKVGVNNGGTGAQSFTAGFLKSPGSTTPFITVANIVESDISFTANSTTGDASTTTHGFLPKLDNEDTHFLDGTGNWSVPIYMYPTGLTLTPSTNKIAIGVQYKSNESGASTVTTTTSNIPAATTTAAGLITTEAQTISGVKTFSNGIISNVTGNVTGNADTSTTINTAMQDPTSENPLNIDEIITPGEYCITKTSINDGNKVFGTLPSGLGSSDGIVLRVFDPKYSNGNSWGIRIVQFAIGTVSGKAFVRTITRSNTSSSWTANSWNQLSFQSDVDNILTGSTTFAGTKTFSSDIVGNLSGNADTASMLDFTSVNTNTTSKNMNDYITPGLYIFRNITTSNLSNSPVPDTYIADNNVNGFLEVFCVNKSPSDSSSIVGFQRFTINRYSSSDNKMAKTYIRGFYKISTTNISDITSSNFTPWKTFLDENDILSLETTVSNILDGTSTVGYANKLKPKVLSSNTISANLNEVIEPGLYYGYYTTNPSGSGISHTNFPSDFPSGRIYYMYVNNYNYGDGTSHSYIIQRLYSVYSGNVIFYIRNVSYNASTDITTDWVKIATNNDISNILSGNITLSGTKTFSSNIIGNLTGNADTSSYLKPINITSSGGTTTDLNDYTYPGLYYFNAATSSDPAHSPIPSSNTNSYIRLYLEVFRNNPGSTSSIIGFQRATYHWYTSTNTSSVKTYVRGFSKSSNNSDPITFTSWKLMLDEKDISSLNSSVSNILSGSTTFAGSKTFSSDIIGNINTSTRLYRNDVSVTDENTANLNDYYIPGLYNFYYSTSSRLLNSPIFNTATGSYYIRGFLEVFSSVSNPTTANSICGFQRFTYHGLSSAESTLKKFAKTYVRGFYKQTNEQFSNMTFTEWKSLLDQNDISSLQTSVSNILDGTTTFAGSKTFSSTITGSITGNSGTADRLKLRYIVGTSTSCDLNNIIEPGLHYGYYSASPSTGVTYSNFPDDFSTNNGDAYIYLYVDNFNYGTDGTNSNQAGIIQRLYSKKTGDIYIRGLAYDSTQTPVNITDNPWVKIAKISDVNAVSTTLSTLSTNLTNKGIASAAQLSGSFDFNDKVSQGIYYLNSTSGTITNYPGSSKSMGWLYVIGTTSASYMLQIFVRAITSPTESTMYYRYRRNVNVNGTSTPTWTNWFRLVAGNESTFIGNIVFASSGPVNLDTYKTQGVYGFVSGNATNENSANFPVALGGTLLVFGNGGTNVTQMYMTYGMNGIYWRQGDFSSTPTGIEWDSILTSKNRALTIFEKSNTTSIKLPNQTSRTYEYCVYEFDAATNVFSNLYVGTAVGNTSITTGSTSKIYKGWYRRIK